MQTPRDIMVEEKDLETNKDDTSKDDYRMIE